MDRSAGRLHAARNANALRRCAIFRRPPAEPVDSNRPALIRQRNQPDRGRVAAAHDKQRNVGCLK